MKITEVIEASLNSMKQIKSRQQGLEDEEVKHFVYNEDVDWRLQVMTVSEIVVILFAFLAEIVVLGRYLKGKDIL